VSVFVVLVHIQLDKLTYYWEGPIGFAGSHTGAGYLEMAGYWGHYRRHSGAMRRIEPGISRFRVCVSRIPE
jgi:Lipocalin-like domain